MSTSNQMYNTVKNILKYNVMRYNSTMHTCSYLGGGGPNQIDPTKPSAYPTQDNETSPYK